MMTSDDGAALCRCWQRRHGGDMQTKKPTTARKSSLGAPRETSLAWSPTRICQRCVDVEVGVEARDDDMAIEPTGCLVAKEKVRKKKI
jgi:hypothetical protein